MKRALLPLSIMLLTPAAMAESKVGQISINPNVGYTVPDSERGINDGVTYGINFEYQTAPNVSLLVFYNESATEFEGDAGAPSDNYFDTQRYGVNARYYFVPEAKLQPYLVGGIGNSEHEFDNETILNLGGGVRYYLTDALSLNGELVGSHTADDDLDDGTVSLGVAYSFGGKKPAPKAAPVAAAPADSDGDGVIDPNDKCPGTPAGVPVDATGCPLDSDKDGVTDDKDQCPGTPVGTKVDARGCVPQKVVVESIKLNIQFPTASHAIGEKYQPEIKKVADFLGKHADVVVDIEGHTDAQGSDKYNQELSQRRADSVKKELLTRYGIAASRVNAIGHGEAKPVASNDSADGRAQNRRVVAVMQKEVLE